MRAEEHLAALREIRDLMRVPVPMPWEPAEVLRLVRWAQPDAHGEHRAGEVGHVMRAFCCAALLRADAEPANECLFGSEGDTLAGATESALALGGSLPGALASFLTWRIPRLAVTDSEGEAPFFALALLVVCLLGASRAWELPVVEELTSLVESAEWSAIDPLGVCTPEMFDGVSFLDRRPVGLRVGTWRALAERVRAAETRSTRLAALMGRLSRA